MNNIAQIFAIIAFFIQSLLASDKIRLSQPFDLAGLSEVRQSCGVLKGELMVSNFSLDPKDCTVYKSPLKGYVYLKVGDFLPYGRPGEPQLPMKTIKVKLPRESEIYGVAITTGSYQEIKNRIKIVPVPQPGIRMKGIKKPEYIPDERIYSSKDYFPGRWLSFESGSDGKHTYCFVRISPVQYIPAEGKAILLTEAVINLYYGPKSSNEQPKSNYIGSEESVIICTAEFQSQADNLKIFHQSEGISSEVVTCEWISANYDTAPRPNYPGYSFEQPAYIQGYDFSLARKIINYLRDTSAHPNLEYVTLLGDAEKVPPSYYYYLEGAFIEVVGWAPSDFIYSSPDYDFVPNYKVGRISVSDTVEANHVVTKIRNWYAGASWSWFQNAVLAGGDAFPDHLTYFDEAMTSDMINREYFTGHNITKCFHTNGAFTASEVASYLSGGDVGILVQLSHGSGDAIYFDDQTSISGHDMLNYSPVTRVPIVLSPACVCGAFDTDLAPTLGFDISFGEGVLKSSAGGIAYFGGSRPNFAGFAWYVEDGRLIIVKEYYMDEIMVRIMDGYHAGIDNLGGLIKEAQFNYVANNPMTDTLNQWTIFCFLLIGDPALKIPAQIPGTNYDTPVLTAQAPTYYNASDFPVYQIQEGNSVMVNSETNSPSVTMKLCNARVAELALETLLDYSPPFEYEFAPQNGPQFYLVRAEAKDGKEGWIYMHTASGKIAVDGDKTDWQLAGLNPIASDSDDFIPDDLEILDLYVTDDQSYWYIGFDALIDTIQYISYGIAIDCKYGGYTGVQGVDQDALGNWITFSDEHPVDYEIYMFPPKQLCGIFAWNDSTWVPAYEIDIFYYTYNDRFTELALPKDMIGNPASISLTLFSTGLGTYYPELPFPQPAQDACPSDPATYHTPHWGQEYANTLTQFVTFQPTGVEEMKKTVPTTYALEQNYPNPFNSETIIEYHLPKDSYVTLKIYNTLGQEIQTLVNTKRSAGYYTVSWNGKDSFGNDVASGIYFYRLKVGEFAQTKKCLFLK